MTLKNIKKNYNIKKLYFSLLVILILFLSACSLNKLPDEANYCENHSDCIDTRTCGEYGCRNYDWWIKTSNSTSDCVPEGGSCVCIPNKCIYK